MNWKRGVFAFALALAACRQSAQERKAEPPASPPPGATARSEAPDRRPAIVAFGDSLTAGLGVAPEESYPAKLQRKLDAGGYTYRVVNAGVSGETSAQGLARLESILELRPALVIIELGGNDGLRGLPVATTRRNLQGILARVRQAGAVVVLAGMQMPPNYGAEYTRPFREMYEDLAREQGVALVPFLLARVAADPELNQADGIHPNARGYDVVVENVWKVLEPLVSRAR